VGSKKLRSIVAREEQPPHFETILDSAQKYGLDSSWIFIDKSEKGVFCSEMSFSQVMKSRARTNGVPSSPRVARTDRRFRLERDAAKPCPLAAPREECGAIHDQRSGSPFTPGVERKREG